MSNAAIYGINENGEWVPITVNTLADGSIVSTVITQDVEYDSTEEPVFPSKYAQTLVYSAGLIQSKSFDDGVNTWTKTYTYTGSDITGISLWVKT